MNQKERPVSKGLEEISHFFLSKAPSEGTKKDASLHLFESSLKLKNKKRVLPFLSFSSNIPSSFFTCNIALDLARQEKKVFIVDVEKRQPNVESTFGLTPASLGLSDIFYPSENKIFRDIDQHLRILVFRLDLISLPSPQKERDKKLLELLSREEAFSEWTLINLPKSNMILQNPEWLSRVNEIVIFMDSQPQNLIETYAFIKDFFLLKPDLTIYVGVCDVSSIQEARESFDKMLKGVMIHLNHSIKSIGYLLKDSSILQSLSEQTPLMKSFNPVVQKGLKAMTQILMDQEAVSPAFFSLEEWN
ncbi:MAG: P-loop NTPase family protein [Nitrospiria bacterium]